MIVSRARTRLVAVVGALTLLAALLAAAAGPAAATGDPADSCATSGPKTITGTVQGEDGRYLWAFIGIEFFDSAGRKIGGASPNSGYHCHIRVNENLVDGEGSVSSNGGQLTKNWSVGAPANTHTVWIELYVKTDDPPGRNSQARYGFAKREKAVVGANGRHFGLVAPLRCGFGNGEVTGTTGSISGVIRTGGAPTPNPGGSTWIAAWDQGGDTDFAIMGWNIGEWRADGSFVVDNLAAGREYSFWIFEQGKAARVHWAIPVRACADTRHDWELGGTAPGAGSGIPMQQIASGDFDGDGYDDLYRYGRSTIPDQLTFGGPRNSTLASTPYANDGLHDLRSGDFDGDGRHDLLLHGPSGSAIWYGRTDRGFDKVPMNVAARYQPFTGDFNGDGRTDIYWYRPGSGADYVFTGSGGRGGWTYRQTNVQAQYAPFVGDFNGDGFDDIFWYRPGAGADYLFFGTAEAGEFEWEAFTVNGTYTPIVGDFEGDGDDDLFWYRAGTRADYLWTATPDGFDSEVYTINGTYQTEALDVDGDGRDDIAWVDDHAGQDDFVFYGSPPGQDFDKSGHARF